MTVIAEPGMDHSTQREQEMTRDFRYEHVRVGDLKIDPSYHPPERFKEHHARRLGAFDEDKVGVITCSHRDGALWLLDGNHRRWLAANSGVTHLYAKVFFGKTQREEAAIFHGLSVQLQLQGLDLWQTRRVEQDPVVVGVEAILHRHGGRIVRGGGNRAGTTRAVSTLERIYATSPELLERVIEMLQRVWPEQQRSLDALPMQAVASFIHVYTQTLPAASLRRLEDRLSVSSPEELYRAEKAQRAVGGRFDTGHAGSSGTGYGAVLGAGDARRAVLGIYNRNLRNKLPDVTMGDLRVIREGRIADLTSRLTA